MVGAKFITQEAALQRVSHFSLYRQRSIENHLAIWVV